MLICAARAFNMNVQDQSKILPSREAAHSAHIDAARAAGGVGLPGIWRWQVGSSERFSNTLSIVPNHD
jgi:hypothetical protein